MFLIWMMIEILLSAGLGSLLELRSRIRHGEGVIDDTSGFLFLSMTREQVSKQVKAISPL